MSPFTARSVTILLMFLILTVTFSAKAGDNQEIWPFQDGSLVITQTSGGAVFSFPYVPFLGMSPAWTPAYPREYQQGVEPVLPLPGLAGKLTFHVLAGTESGPLQVLSRTPYSADTTIRNGSSELHLSWVCPLGQPGVVFECANSQQREATLEIGLNCFPERTLWATPAKKMKHNWGNSQWEWKAGERYLLHLYSIPVDATHSPNTAFWIGEISPEWKGPTLTYLPNDPQHLRLIIPLHPGQSIRFGFEHADNLGELMEQLAVRRKAPIALSKLSGEWNTWLADSYARMKTKTGSDPAQIPTDKKRILDNNLQTTRQLFLSNGAVLTRPMTPDSYPVSISEQGVALNHWRSLGLEFPFQHEQAELARFNRVHQRSISIPVFRKGGAMETLSQGRIVMAAPDSSSPPDKASFDTVLGYVISGGHLTLVDGVEGFRGKEGWWKEAGASDLVDYAIRMLGVPVNPASRRTLDEEGLAPNVNTFLAGLPPITQGTSTSSQTISVQPPKAGGYILLCPSTKEETAGLRILSGRIGGEVFQPFTTGEDRFLAGGYAPRAMRDEFGQIVGCELLGEAFRAYQIPASATGALEFTLTGAWTVAWSEFLPATQVMLRKKAFQAWYKHELMQVPISRLCHPVVYDGTYTCRVFDVSGTESSPILYAKVGHGSFVWLGLPRDYLLLGSDTGSDLQNSLRNDPTYDLVRLTFAFHDPKRAGAERSSRAPLSGWGEGWSQSLVGVPDAFHAYFAWRPIEVAGLATQEMNGWVEDTFTNTLEYPQSEGQTVLNHALITREIGDDRRILELPDNAFRYAVYKGLERTSRVKGRVWMQDDSRNKAEEIVKDLPVLLEGFGENAVFARAIVDGSPQAAIPSAALLPRAAWAATEINPADFPGGATGQAHLLNTLANDPAALDNPHAMAVLASRDEKHRAQFLGQLLEHNTEPVLGLIGSDGKRFDLATAVPALRAIVLSGRK